jgi:hypothetical protein
MQDLPVHLRYTLDRQQRLIPHLKIWGKGLAIVAVLGFTFFFVETIYCIVVLQPIGTLIMGTIAFMVFVMCRRLFNGLWDVLINQIRVMDIIIDDSTLGILVEDERWYLPLEGFTSIDQFCDGIWTLQHVNGAVINAPDTVINVDIIEMIRKAMSLKRAPEGIHGVIDRGQWIQHIFDSHE